MTRVGRRGRKDPIDGALHCRRCDVPLMDGNARLSRGRFVGVCRPCESEEARRRKGSVNRYTDTRRKYPVPGNA